MTSWHGHLFRITGPLWVDSTGDRWIPPQWASDAELWCFLWCKSEHAAEQAVELLVTWETMTLMWRHCDHSVDRSHILYTHGFGKLSINNQHLYYVTHRCSCVSDNLVTTGRPRNVIDPITRTRRQSLQWYILISVYVCNILSDEHNEDGVNRIQLVSWSHNIYPFAKIFIHMQSGPSVQLCIYILVTLKSNVYHMLYI